MKKSIIGKKSELKKAQKEFANFGTQYIQNWTKKELKKYINKPVVIPHGEYGFFIGPYKVQGITPECWEITSRCDDRFSYIFINKLAAILYCMYSVNQKYNLASELLEIDTKLGRLSTDLKHYEFSLKNAQKKGDSTKHLILLNRYIDAKMQRQTYANILKKTLNSAKYINFGKEPL